MVSMDDITPYSEATPDQKKILDEMGRIMKKAGYKPHQGWIRNQKRYEVYSKEIDPQNHGIPACSCVVLESGVGFLTHGVSSIRFTIERKSKE
jgi:hypothetical protein